MQHMPIVKPVIIRFMYEDDMILLYITLSFQIKKISNSKHFAHVGFCASEMSAKFWDFAAGMDFGT